MVPNASVVSVIMVDFFQIVVFHVVTSAIRSPVTGFQAGSLGILGCFLLNWLGLQTIFWLDLVSLGLARVVLFLS